MKSSQEGSKKEESKGPQIVDVNELLNMDVERQQAYNNTIDIRELIIEEDPSKTDSMSGFSHTVHTSSYRSHATSTLTGQTNLEYTDEIIEFNEDQKIEILDYINSNKNREQLIKIRKSETEVRYLHSAVLRYAFSKQLSDELLTRSMV